MEYGRAGRCGSDRWTHQKVWALTAKFCAAQADAALIDGHFLALSIAHLAQRPRRPMRL